MTVWCTLSNMSRPYQDPMGEDYWNPKSAKLFLIIFFFYYFQRGLNIEMNIDRCTKAKEDVLLIC